MQYFELELKCGHYYAVTAVDTIERRVLDDDGKPKVETVPYEPDYTKLGVGDHPCGSVGCDGDTTVVAQRKTKSLSRRHGLPITKKEA